MCAVAGRGLFRGMSADDLAGLGIGFSLFDMPALAGLATRVVAEEQALRRPVTVVDHAEPMAPPIADSDGTAEPSRPPASPRRANPSTCRSGSRSPPSGA